MAGIMTFSKTTERLARRIAVLALSVTLTAAVVLAGVLPAASAEPTATPPSSPTLSTTPITLTVTGTVISGTAGVGLPAGLPVTLHIAHADKPGALPTKTAKWDMALGPDNTFRFENIPAWPGDLAFVTANFQGVMQGSLLIPLASGQSSLNVPVTLYALTSDSSVITLIRVQHILDFNTPGFMQVLATYDYKNVSDRLYLSDRETDKNQPISVEIPLPIGARAIAFSTQPLERFALGGNLNARIVQDTSPVLPGEVHEIIFSYQVPYEGGAPIDQDYPYSTTTLEVLIPDDSHVTIDGTDFTQSPNTAIDPNRPYTQYILKTPLKAGARLVYMLSGMAHMATPSRVQAAGGTATTTGSSRGVQLGDLLIAAGIMLIVAGVGIVVGWRFWRARKQPGSFPWR
jgi:hypothetical protein